MLKQSGITTDDKPVMAGVFRVYETHGIPLETILFGFRRDGRVVDWVDFVEAARAAGANMKSMKTKILAAVSEIYGAQYAAEFEPRINSAVG